MALLYNLALRTGFLLLTPRFIYDAVKKGKYAAGFKQRLGYVPEFRSSTSATVLLHCVSVGETNAALPLARRLKERFPDISLVLSTTTKTGQELAAQTYAGIADLIVYFPFDFPGSVRRFLRAIRPDLVLLTETELWYNFIHTSAKTGTRVAIVNGRLSGRSYRRYARVTGFMKRLLSYVDLALMQSDTDAERVLSLGIAPEKVHVTGNLKFDISDVPAQDRLTDEFRGRFCINANSPLILAASTHEPEEQMLIAALQSLRKHAPDEAPRLMLVPRHPERFNAVARLVESAGFTVARRSFAPSEADTKANVIVLDSVGELRSAYPLADIVFVGGSLIPHGGQSIFEPAAAGRAIVTGPYTANFDAAVKEFISRDAIIQLSEATAESLAAVFADLLNDHERRDLLGRNAASVLRSNRGAVDRTLDMLSPLVGSRR